MKNASEMRKIAEDANQIKDNCFLEQLEIKIEALAKHGDTIITYYGDDVNKFTKYVIDTLLKNGYKVNQCEDYYYTEVSW